MTGLNKESRNYYLLFNLPLQLIGIASLFLLTNIPVFLITFVISYIVIYWLGVQAGAHKLFSHKTWTPRNNKVRYFIAGLSCFGFMGGPIIWAQIHRQHHLHEDTDLDPHSPKFGKIHSYYLWLFNIRDMPLMSVKDLLRDKTLVKINYYCREIVLYFLLFVILINFNVFAGILVAGILTFHSEMAVNTFLHYRNPEDKKWTSRNNKVLSLISGGSTLHKNHHLNLRLADLKVNNWEFDGSYLFIKILKL